MMLETPLRGRFLLERHLIFAPPNAYLCLVAGCVFGGVVLILLGLATGVYWLFVGAMVFGAGVLAALSLNWIAFDIREKTYTRRDGAAHATRFARGSFSDLEAIFVLAESRPSIGHMVTVGHAVTYRIVLQWLGLRLPSVILEQDYRALPPGAPLGYAAATSIASAENYARALRLPVVNHTHVSVSNPII